MFGPNFGNDGEFQKTASVMKLVVEGYAGAGTISMGGYDYHTGDRSTGETDPHGLELADGADETLRPAGARHDADPHLRLAERGGFARQHDVARERDLETAAERRTVQRRNDGHIRLENGGDGTAERPHHATDTVGRVIRHVDTGAESPRPLTGQQQHFGPGIRTHGSHGIRQLVQHALARFLNDGMFGRHVRRSGAVYRERHGALGRRAGRDRRGERFDVGERRGAGRLAGGGERADHVGLLVEKAQPLVDRARAAEHGVALDQQQRVRDRADHEERADVAVPSRDHAARLSSPSRSPG